MEISAYHPFISASAKKEYLKMYDEKAKGWPVPSETKMVDTSFGQTFVRISGPAGGRPLVLLSGFGGNSLSWMPQIKAWSENYRIYAVDNVFDYGRSVHSRIMESQDDYVDWFDELFRALGLEQVNLVGKSYGGWLACQYAYCRPSRLRSVVMMAPAATVLPLRKEFIERMIKGIGSPKDFIFWVYKDFVHKDEASRKAPKRWQTKVSFRHAALTSGHRWARRSSRITSYKISKYLRFSWSVKMKRSIRHEKLSNA